MPYITARLSDHLIVDLDRAANELRRTRSDLVREAVERYLESFHDLRQAVERPEGHDERVVEWEAVKRQLLG